MSNDSSSRHGENGDALERFAHQYEAWEKQELAEFLNDPG